MQEHWLGASFKMELRKMLHGELLHAQWSCTIVGWEAGQRSWLAVKQGADH